MEVDMLRNNKEDGFSPGSMLHLWTAQTDAVLDCIRENGFSQVRNFLIILCLRQDLRNSVILYP